MALKKQYSKTSNKCSVSFDLNGENLQSVSKIALLGDFNDWNGDTHLLKKDKKGNYGISIELNTGKSYEFRYLLDNATWLNDEQGDNYTWSRVSSDENFVVILEAQNNAASKVKVETVTKKAASAPAKKAAVPRKTEKVKTVAVAKKSVEAIPVKKSASKADDLTIIEGIGPVVAKALMAAGIATFDALSKAKSTAVKEILAFSKSKVQHLDPGTWAKQAKLAASGKFSELEKLKVELNNGKVVK